jgi:hypothetical protein
MNQFYFQAIIWAVGVIFGAGGAWAALRQTRRDMNGIGTKTRLIEDKAADRYTAISFAILISAPEDKRLAVAQILLNAALRR